MKSSLCIRGDHAREKTATDRRAGQWITVSFVPTSAVFVSDELFAAIFARLFLTSVFRSLLLLFIPAAIAL